MQPKAQATVLIVEDDAGIAELERDRLDAVGYRVMLAASAVRAWRGRRMPPAPAVS